MWVALLKEKSEALYHFKRFKSIAKFENEVKIKCVRSDRGEFTSEELRRFCDKNGTKRQLTAPHSRTERNS